MQTRFEFRDFVHVFGFNIILFALFSAVFSSIPGLLDFTDSLHPAVEFLFAYIIQFVVLFVPLWAFVVIKYKTTLQDFGFKKIPIGKMLLTILLSYVAYIGLAFVISTLLFSTDMGVPGYEQQDSYIPLFGDDALGFTIATMVIVVLAPILEEVFFRGFIYRILTKVWPIWFGSIMTALLFSFVHFQLASFFPILLLGLVLNYTYQRTGSIWTSIGFHSLNNAVAFGLDVYLYYNPELINQLELIAGIL